MTIHYHMTPITPETKLRRLAGRHFGVSFATRRQVALVHELGQSVMIDNGAYTAFTGGSPIHDWAPFYEWCDPWLDYPTTWAVIPDEIDGPEERQDELISQWPFGDHGAPVWHTNERLERLAELTEKWPLVCIGSTAQHWKVGSDLWSARLDEVFEEMHRIFGRAPRLHMMRGMSQCGKRWPFYSVDSSSVAQNSHRFHAPLLEPLGMQCGADEYAQRFDGIQCPPRWVADRKGRAA